MTTCFAKYFVSGVENHGPNAVNDIQLELPAKHPFGIWIWAFNISMGERWTIAIEALPKSHVIVLMIGGRWLVFGSDGW